MGKPVIRLWTLTLAAILLWVLGSAGAACFAATPVIAVPAGDTQAVSERQWLKPAGEPEPDAALCAGEPCKQPQPGLGGYQAAFLLTATLFALLFALARLADGCRFPAHLGAGIRLTCCHIQRAPPSRPWA